MATIRVLPTHKADSKLEGLALTRTEFKAMLNDPTKRIEGDIVWQEDEDRSPCLEFRAEIQSDSGWPLFVRGSYNPLIPALSYVLLLKTFVARPRLCIRVG